MSNRPRYPPYLINRVLTRGMTIYPSKAFVFRSGIITCPVPLEQGLAALRALGGVAAYAINIRPKEGYHGHVVG